MTETLQPLEFTAQERATEHTLVRMRDGVGLATDVYLPKAVARTEAILIRTPYDRRGTFGYMAFVARAFVEHGYGVVVQDVRGKCGSEGVFEPFVQEVDDGTDTIEWIVAQPWSNGVVGMFGDSYFGFTQWAAAAGGHPALRAIAPRVTSTSISTDWLYHQGVLRLQFLVEWCAFTWIDAGLYEVEVDWSVRPLSEVVLAATGRRSAVLDRWTAMGREDPYWTGLLGGRAIDTLDIPVLHSAGWWDVFRRGQLRDWAAMRGSPSRARQHLVIDAVDHMGNRILDDGEQQTDFFSSPDAARRGAETQVVDMIPFFERYLRGREVTLPSIRWRLAHGDWHEDGQWPPRGAAERRLFLAEARRAALGPEGGALAPIPERRRTSARWTHDAEQLVPSVVLDPMRPLLELPDERDVETRPDVLTFSSTPAVAPLDLVGPAAVVLAFESTAAETHMMAKLVDVHPTGAARRISEGAALVSHADSRATVRVEFGHLGYRLRSGHRLRLEIASSDFPNYIWDPATGADSFAAVASGRCDQTVWCGGETGSHVVLSVLSGR